VAGCCECGDEPSGSCATELVELVICPQIFIHFFASRVRACMSICLRSRVSSVSTVSDYGLDDRAIGVRSPAGAKNFSSSLFVQTGSGAHPTPCTIGTGGPFPVGKSAAGA
jgi:hypothetical protein